jgi:hypothetical protein
LQTWKPTKGCSSKSATRSTNPYKVAILLTTSSQSAQPKVNWMSPAWILTWWKN